MLVRFSEAFNFMFITRAQKSWEWVLAKWSAGCDETDGGTNPSLWCVKLQISGLSAETEVGKTWQPTHKLLPSFRIGNVLFISSFSSFTILIHCIFNCLISAWTCGAYNRVLSFSNMVSSAETMNMWCLSFHLPKSAYLGKHSIKVVLSLNQYLPYLVGTSNTLAHLQDWIIKHWNALEHDHTISLKVQQQYLLIISGILMLTSVGTGEGWVSGDILDPSKDTKMHCLPRIHLWSIHRHRWS